MIVAQAVLRQKGTRKGGDAATATLSGGSQVEIRLNCTTAATKGKVGVRTLATGDGQAFTEIGYDFDVQAFYAGQ